LFRRYGFRPIRLNRRMGTYNKRLSRRSGKSESHHIVGARDLGSVNKIGGLQKAQTTGVDHKVSRKLSSVPKGFRSSDPEVFERFLKALGASVPVEIMAPRKRRPSGLKS
jgi:hypothetical protein